MVGGGRDEARKLAELEVVDLSLVSATSEHERTRRVLRVHLPDTDQGSLLASRGQQVTLAVHGHSRDGSLMAHYHCFDAPVGEGSHFDVAFLRVRDGEHAGAFAVQGTETVLVVAGIQAVHDCEVFEFVHIGLDLQHDDDARQKAQQN